MDSVLVILAQARRRGFDSSGFEVGPVGEAVSDPAQDLELVVGSLEPAI